MNHFKNSCLKLKKRNTVNAVGGNEQASVPVDSDSSEDEYSYGIRRKHCVSAIGDRMPTVQLVINNVKTEVVIDTGATVNILDETSYRTIGNPPLNKNQSVLVDLARVYARTRSSPLLV